MPVLTSTFRTHLRVDEILSGSMLALIWIHKDTKFARPAVWSMRYLFPAFFVLWVLSTHTFGGALNYIRPYLAATVVGSTLFMMAGPMKNFLSSQSLRYVANISYALYIWHPISMFGWLGTGTDYGRYLIMRPISFAITFLLAHLSSRTVEAKAVELGKRAVKK